MVAREDDKILGAQEVADLLDMNVQMVRKYAREGRLPAYRLPGGRTFKFFRSEILAYLRRFPVDTDEMAAEPT
ncbi:MAG: helix-turn-helix domain-containing protein [bacterium]|nr:helix-turn-helix domain-containing protein [bacterium]